ncbi:energy-coupling factor transporter transmembrane protein EcfT [Nocardiopsis sp. MG754419]|uniref:energy-coupling factor transporter transmembrane component T family protein n=1 Tax=Nocardiopsis sp. MG754419 TaxID=2259865 RepID=UPI001BAA9F33|nr:energy-coupling factor transporter transmembrane protein EcfT [Nocardiopsis sp. MG754419]MBR8742202.1 energy-coupling factor transporter transmembrane protein EcfT [Nocardiopsis sp. MG754419]
MSVLGLYVPGTGPLHRIPAGPKLLALLVLGVALIAVADLWVALTVLVVALVLYPVTGLGARRALAVLRVLWPFLLAIGVFQALFVGAWTEGVRLCAQLAALVLLANAITLSTRVAEMLALFERLARPLRRVGADPDRVALVLALTIRSIPMVAAAWTAARDGYRARGLRNRPHLLVVPVIVHLLRMAEATGEALVARGIDEDSESAHR